jgi:hypothetical protein
MPIADWAETFLSLCRGCRRRPRRRTGATSSGTCYLAAAATDWAGCPGEEIEQWLNEEIDEGIAPSSVHRHYRTLRRMLAVAVEK